MARTVIDLQLVRRFFAVKATEGDLTVDGLRECVTLEDHSPWSDPAAVKVPGRTCIPPGRYKIVLVDSQRFGTDTLSLVGVPGFTAIRIHAGNTSAQTEGCILVGQDATAPDDDWIGRSAAALKALKVTVIQRLRAGEEAWITITEARGA